MITIKTLDGIVINTDDSEQAIKILQTMSKTVKREQVQMEVKKVHKHRFHYRMHNLGKGCLVCGTPLKGFSLKKQYCKECKRQRVLVRQKERANRKRHESQNHSAALAELLTPVQ